MVFNVAGVKMSALSTQRKPARVHVFYLRQSIVFLTVNIPITKPLYCIRSIILIITLITLRQLRELKLPEGEVLQPEVPEKMPLVVIEPVRRRQRPSRPR